MRKTFYLLAVATASFAVFSCTKDKSLQAEQSAATVDQSKAASDKQKNMLDFTATVTNIHALSNGEREYDLTFYCTNIGKAIDSVRLYDEYNLLVTLPVVDGAVTKMVRPSKLPRNTPYLARAVAVDKKGEVVQDKWYWYFIW